MPVAPNPQDVMTQNVQIAKRLIDLESGVQRVTNAISDDMTQLSRQVNDLGQKVEYLMRHMEGVERALAAALRGVDVGYGPGQVSPSTPGYVRDVGVPTHALRPQEIDLVGRQGAASVASNRLSTGAPPRVQEAERASLGETLWYEEEGEEDAEMG